LLILSLFPNTFGFNLFLQVHYALGGLCMYLYLGRLRLKKYSAFVGGLMFMVCGFSTAHRGHECMICVAVWLPLTLKFIHRYAESLQIMDLGYAAVPFALSILAGFPQIPLYAKLVVLAYIPFCIAGSPLLREWKTKLVHIVSAAVVVFGIGGLLGCLPLVINSGATPPARGLVRLYTVSTSPIEIGNLQVRELESLTAKAFSLAETTPNGITIFENANALPRFRFAHRVTPARNLDNALHLMGEPGFDPADDVVVEGIDNGGVLAAGRFLSEELEDTRLEWDVETSGRSFLVVADTFLPGWTASVDDRPTPVYAVYGCLRGISIDTAGRHHVEMRFAPHTLPAALVCSGIGLLLLGLFWLGQKTGRLSRPPFACDHRAPAPRQ
jgi:hypothetical protein